MRNYARLSERVGGRRLTRLVAVRRECRLRFPELLVYSTLLYRGRAGQTKAARLTGLDRTRVVPRVLARLTALSLVRQDGRLYEACDPPADMAGWFSRREAGRLAKSFNYNWIGVRSGDSPLTNMGAAVVPLLMMNVPHASIARFVRVSRKTVIRVAKFLEGNPFNPMWLQEKGKVKRRVTARKAKAAPPTGKRTLADVIGVTDSRLVKGLYGNCNYMLDKGMSDKDTRRFWKDLLATIGNKNGDTVEGWIFGFKPRFDRVNADHNRRFMEEKTNADSCYFLLREEFSI